MVLISNLTDYNTGFAAVTVLTRSCGSQIVTSSKILTVVRTMVPNNSHLDDKIFVELLLSMSDRRCRFERLCLENLHRRSLIDSNDSTKILSSIELYFWFSLDNRFFQAIHISVNYKVILNHTFCCPSQSTVHTPQSPSESRTEHRSEALGSSAGCITRVSCESLVTETDSLSLQSGAAYQW